MATPLLTARARSSPPSTASIAAAIGVDGPTDERRAGGAVVVLRGVGERGVEGAVVLERDARGGADAAGVVVADVVGEAVVGSDSAAAEIATPRVRPA